MSSNQSLYIQRGHGTDVIEKRYSFKVDIIIISLIALVHGASTTTSRHASQRLIFTGLDTVETLLRRYDRLCVNQ